MIFPDSRTEKVRKFINDIKLDEVAEMDLGCSNVVARMTLKQVADKQKKKFKTKAVDGKLLIKRIL